MGTIPILAITTALLHLCFHGKMKKFGAVIGSYDIKVQNENKITLLKWPALANAFVIFAI